REEAAAGLYGQRRFRSDAMIMDELAETAQAVAAHLRLAAVGVEHPHARIGPLRGTDKDEAIRADATMSIADDLAQLGGMLWRRVMDAIDVDVVVAQPVHLPEFHRHYPSSGLRLCASTHPEGVVAVSRADQHDSCNVIGDSRVSY